MLELRAEGAGNEARPRLRALAEEFPGALRELDRTPTEELSRRAEACARAAAGDEAEAWIGWMARYHELWRERLAERRAGAATGGPGARINPVVVQKIAEEFGVSAATVAETLFPRRRR